MAEEKKVYTQEEFLSLYNELVKETGFMILAHPEFKFRDDNTWSIVVLQTIEKVPEKNK